MEEPIKDVNVEETKVESTEEKTSSESSTDKEEKVIPYDRFSEVVKERNELREKISKVETKVEKNLTPEEKKESDAKQYLKNLYKEVMTEEEKLKQQQEEQELNDFNKEVSSALELNTDVKRDDFLKFVEEKSKTYGIESVSGAMALYKDLNKSVLEAKNQGKKEILSRPKTPVNEGQSSTSSYDKNKSFYQIAEEAKRELNN